MISIVSSQNEDISKLTQHDGDETSKITVVSKRALPPLPKDNGTNSISVEVTRSPRSALLDLNWKDVMESKFQALQKNQTWTLLAQSNDDNIINTKWVFKVKQQEDGIVERYKMRWVTNEMRHIEGSNNAETFSSMVKGNSVQIVLTVAVSKDLKKTQLDISNAFLHGTFDEKVIISQLAGFKTLIIPNMFASSFIPNIKENPASLLALFLLNFGLSLCPAMFRNIPVNFNGIQRASNLLRLTLITLYALDTFLLFTILKT